MYQKKFNNNFFFSGDMCEKRFIFRGRLRVHRRSCGLNSPVPCKVCNKLFINYTNLNHHVVVHAYM